MIRDTITPCMIAAVCLLIVLFFTYEPKNLSFLGGDDHWGNVEDGHTQGETHEEDDHVNDDVETQDETPQDETPQDVNPYQGDGLMNMDGDIDAEDAEYGDDEDSNDDDHDELSDYFEEFDTNGDNKLDVMEFDQYNAYNDIKKLDKDGDGLLNTKELEDQIGGNVYGEDSDDMEGDLERLKQWDLERRMQGDLERPMQGDLERPMQGDLERLKQGDLERPMQQDLEETRDDLDDFEYVHNKVHGVDNSYDIDKRLNNIENHLDMPHQFNELDVNKDGAVTREEYDKVFNGGKLCGAPYNDEKKGGRILGGAGCGSHKDKEYVGGGNYYNDEDQHHKKHGGGNHYNDEEHHKKHGGTIWGGLEAFDDSSGYASF